MLYFGCWPKLKYFFGSNSAESEVTAKFISRKFANEKVQFKRISMHWLKLPLALVLIVSACSSENARNGNGYLGTNQNPATMEKPDSPQNFEAVGGDSKVTLSWSASTGAESYLLLRSEKSGGGYDEANDVAGTTYVDSAVQNAKIYYYIVRGVNEKGLSKNSMEVNATPNAFAVRQPSFVGMASVTGGTFNMGDAFNEGSPDERPVHAVTLSDFKMDVNEVSNLKYSECVAANSCTAPFNLNSFGTAHYYDDATYAEYPVVYVSWVQANAYCIWANKRLPSEAEWEYAARGGLIGKRFPWGDLSDCSHANYYHDSGDPYEIQAGPNDYCVGDTVAGGSYPANGYGLYHMMGNVWEWVNDWYDSTYYSNSQNANPKGPTGGSYRVLRGGSLNTVAAGDRVSGRHQSDPDEEDYVTGFRCAW